MIERAVFILSISITFLYMKYLHSSWFKKEIIFSICRPFDGSCTAVISLTYTRITLLCNVKTVKKKKKHPRYAYYVNRTVILLHARAPGVAILVCNSTVHVMYTLFTEELPSPKTYLILNIFNFK